MQSPEKYKAQAFFCESGFDKERNTEYVYLLMIDMLRILYFYPSGAIPFRGQYNAFPKRKEVNLSFFVSVRTNKPSIY